jgi:hypothetical protein
MRRRKTTMERVGRRRMKMRRRRAMRMVASRMQWRI